MREAPHIGIDMAYGTHLCKDTAQRMAWAVGREWRALGTVVDGVLHWGEEPAGDHDIVRFCMSMPRRNISFDSGHERSRRHPPRRAVPASARSAAVRRS